MIIVGTVQKKIKKTRPVRAEIIIKDKEGELFSLQLRPKHFDKLVEIDKGATISFTVTNKLSAIDKHIINNLTVIDAKRV